MTEYFIVPEEQRISIFMDLETKVISNILSGRLDLNKKSKLWLTRQKLLMTIAQADRDFMETSKPVLLLP